MLAPSWLILGHIGDMSGLCLLILDLSWGILEQFWTILELCWQILSYMAHFGSHDETKMSQVTHNWNPVGPNLEQLGNDLG